MADIIMTLEEFLGHVKSQAFRLHIAASRGNLDEVRQYFEKIRTLQLSLQKRDEVERERQIATDLANFTASLEGLDTATIAKATALAATCGEDS